MAEQTVLAETPATPPKDPRVEELVARLQSALRDLDSALTDVDSALETLDTEPEQDWEEPAPPLAELVLAVHLQDHEGPARWCSYEMCRVAHDG